MKRVAVSAATVGLVVRCFMHDTVLREPLRLQRLRYVERTEDCTVLIPAEAKPTMPFKRHGCGFATRIPGPLRTCRPG